MKKLFQVLPLFILALAILSFFTINNVNATESPDQIVRSSTNEMLTIIKSDKELKSGNIEKLETILDEKVFINFNFPHMTKLALGRAWRDVNDVQKIELNSQFKKLLVNTYSKSLSQYVNQKVEVKPLKLSPNETEVTVKTLVSQSSGQSIPIDYSMENTESGWKAYDILIDGVSLVSTYRSSFDTEIQKSGIDGLIGVLKQRNAKNSIKK